MSQARDPAARPDESLLVRVRGGARIAVPRDLGQMTSYVLLEQEDWFEDEIRFVRRCLREGMRAIDIGANFGTYCVAMGRAVGNTGHVWAFEPTAATADYLRQTLLLNGLDNVELVRKAVSSRTGVLPFTLRSGSELNAVGEAGADEQGARVDAVALDEAAEGWTGVDFVKIDVEGHESEVLQGASAWLRRESPLVMFEVRADTADLRPAELLAGLGYDLYRLLPGFLVLVPFSGRPDAFQLNLFACKRDRAEKLAAEGLLVTGAEVAEPAAEFSSWLAYVRGTPYAVEFERPWRAAANSARRPGREAYLRGLAEFSRAQDPHAPMPLRVSRLDRASRSITEALRAFDSPWRRLSYARLAWELGARSHAVTTLKAVAQSDSTLEEPFLSPSARYDQVPVGGDVGGWLRCAVIEQLERLHAHSSFFMPEACIAHAQAIANHPFCSLEMTRRLQLSRFRLGLRPRLLPEPALQTESEDNLNAEFWRAPPIPVRS